LGVGLAAATIALEISSRNARVAALQKRWDRLRAGLELVLDHWGADMADLPGGTSGLLGPGLQGEGADRLVTRTDPGVVSLVAELCGHERQAAEELEQRKTRVEERKPLDASPAAITLGMPDDAGGARGAGTEGDGTGEEGAGVHGVFDAQRRPRPAEQPLRGQRAPRLREFRKDRGSTPGEGDDLMIPGVMSWQKANPMAH
jgi:hypothetical protein